MHTKNCGMAKHEKCVCTCKGARHQELTKKAAPEVKNCGTGLRNLSNNKPSLTEAA
ncbi:MAG: hypothetical protein WCC94_03575 [Candidatus Bathyarchaeia archaeon]